MIVSNYFTFQLINSVNLIIIIVIFPSNQIIVTFFLVSETIALDLLDPDYQ